MNIYNKIIDEVNASLEAFTSKRYDYDPACQWPCHDKFELIMAKDAAYGLGGSGRSSVSSTLLTTDSSIIEKDEVLVYGPELSELSDDAPYARIAMLRVGDIESDDDDTEVTFRAIQAIDFIKYHVFPEGFMMRTSSEMHRENVRVSKKAVKDGIAFSTIGNSFIRKYKENPDVLAARIIFITDPAVDYALLTKCAKSAHDVTMALTKILEGMSTDCSHCQLKPICDEVEELKELHFGKKDKNNN